MLLDGKKLLVTGVLDRRSIAFSIAEEAQKAGAEIVLTSFGRVMNITKMMAKRLPTTPDVLELDATRPEDVAAVCEEVQRRWGRLDGASDRREGRPGLRLHRGGVGPPGAAGLGHDGPERAGEDGLRAAQRLPAGDDGRGDPRRRRPPCDGSRAARAGLSPKEPSP